MKKRKKKNDPSTRTPAQGAELAERRIREALQIGATGLDLIGLDLTELPDSISQLTQLQTLDLGGNRLTELPDSMGQLTQLQVLDLSRNQLTELPASMGQLTQLQRLYLYYNQLTELPASIGQLEQLQFLHLFANRLTKLPASVSQLTQLRSLHLPMNRFTVLPEWIGQLTQLQILDLFRNELTVLPASMGRLTQLQTLDLRENQLTELPASMGQLTQLQKLDLDDNQLEPNLAAAYQEGTEAVLRYLNAKSQASVALNEAKLILVGEGEVGKSCLVDALRGVDWEDHEATHGIRIEKVEVTDPDTGAKFLLNAWDFGGQKVYRPTHQLFFSAPAVYLVVWKPREGTSQGLVNEWISMIKHREPEAKILVVATHGGPQQRLPDIDRQEVWDRFGRETVLDFFHVDSRPDGNGERRGIEELKAAIAEIARGMVQDVPKRWQQAREALEASGQPHMSLGQVMGMCREHGMDDAEVGIFVSVSHRLGRLVHYEHDAALKDMVVLKPDWLTTAISFVLDDKETREAHGLAPFSRLSRLWNDPSREAAFRYPPELHERFLRLMERYDLCYPTAESRWRPRDQRAILIAQLVDDVRPDLSGVWPAELAPEEGQQTQICRIAEKQGSNSAPAEGLLYQLIVRFHRYSLGREQYDRSVHWQRGFVLDDDYNGRALVEMVGNDLRITVRAVVPERFLSGLTYDVQHLVEDFWPGLRCDVVVPCAEPCGKSAPGTGQFEVQKLIESRKKGKTEYPCPSSGCDEWQSIEGLLRNAPAARPTSPDKLLLELSGMKGEMRTLRATVTSQHGESLARFDGLDIGLRRILSKIDRAYDDLLRSLTDEAKDGPRLFSVEPVSPGFFGRPKWVSEKFRVTLWCEHSRLPVTILNGEGEAQGVYDLEIPRAWFAKAVPVLRAITSTLSLVLPAAGPLAKVAMEEGVYKRIESQLEAGLKSLESVAKLAEKALDPAEMFEEAEAPGFGGRSLVEARGAELRQLHVWLKAQDPAARFGNLVRVQDKQRRFLWVHPRFASEY